MSDKPKNERKKMVTEVFVEGANRGLNIAIRNMLPNVIMAFVIIHALNISGVLAIIGKVLGPVMAIFGLPGEGATVLAGAWLSMGGGVGVAASLYANGLLDARDVAVLIPAIFLMGAQVQYAGRLLGVAKVNSKHWPMLFAICIINALIALLIMNYILVPIFH
ncbi:hypothetical protein ES695_14895 [Candidatus Atribacteria bacterium 1244-E10-H5-B2]|nr:MAG: hypothetical protein ES695_14895 [Candidatus Atribacteria bacterium 1244-E10-H5-B2]